jgi:hypothetical protein
MEINVHTDQIWRNNQLNLDEQGIAQKLISNTNKNVCLVDAIIQDDSSIPDNEIIITDNQFNIPVKDNVINVAPEFWHIYYFENNLTNINPNYKFNCLMNRISCNRLLLLYKMYERDLLKNNLISFNCQTTNRTPDSRVQRIQTFDDFHHIQCEWAHYNSLKEELKRLMPLMISYMPDQAALLSEITIVAETYVHDRVIAFSEKIFRALQLPRPWLISGSPGSVKTLREHGFDVLDDCVDHSYDGIYDEPRRLDHILNQIQNNYITVDISRAEQAAAHNQLVLQDLATKWPAKLDKIIKDVTITV